MQKYKPNTCFNILFLISNKKFTNTYICINSYKTDNNNNKNEFQFMIKYIAYI